MAPVDSETRTIMFIDVVNYTLSTSNFSRRDVHQFHDQFDDLTLPTINKFKGKVIKKMGDAFLITFKSATSGLECSLDLQNQFKKYNLNKRKRDKIRVRISLHTGEVVMKQKDIYGEAVNIASRIQKFAKAGRIVFTSAVWLSMNKNEIPHRLLGVKKVKGIRKPIRVFIVTTAKHLRNKKVRKRTNRIFWTFIKLLILLLIITLLYYFFFSNNIRL